MKRFPYYVIAVALLASCDQPSAPVVPEMTVDAQAWSGGSIVAQSLSFADSGSLPVVTLADSPLTVHRLDFQRASVDIPDTTGPIVLRFRFSSGAYVDVGVRVFGFSEYYQGAPLSMQEVLPGTPYVVGAGTVGLVRMSVIDGLALPVGSLPSSAHTAECGGPFTMYNSNLVVTRRTSNPPTTYCDKVEAWQLGPSVAKVDSIAPYNLSDPLYGAVYLGNQRWIAGYKGTTYAIDHGQATTLHPNGPRAFAVSPSGQRIVGLLGNFLSGAPVYDATSLTIAYRVPGISWPVGAGFSADGDTTFLAGKLLTNAGYEDHLVALNTQTGQIYRDTTIEFYDPYCLVAEPDRPWLYLPDAESDGSHYRVVVHVYDRRTMTQVAELKAPASAPSLASSHWIVGVLDPLSRDLYVVATAQNVTPAQPSTIYRFALLP